VRHDQRKIRVVVRPGPDKPFLVLPRVTPHGRGYTVVSRFEIRISSLWLRDDF
jgi:hypothetical protein